MGLSYLPNQHACVYMTASGWPKPESTPKDQKPHLQPPSDSLALHA